MQIWCLAVSMLWCFLFFFADLIVGLEELELHYRCRGRSTDWKIRIATISARMVQDPPHTHTGTYTQMLHLPFSNLPLKKCPLVRSGKTDPVQFKGVFKEGDFLLSKMFCKQFSPLRYRTFICLKKANLCFKSPSPKPHLNRTGSVFALPNWDVLKTSHLHAQFPSMPFMISIGPPIPASDGFPSGSGWEKESLVRKPDSPYQGSGSPGSCSGSSFAPTRLSLVRICRDRYDWTSGAPHDGNWWKKYRVVARAHPSRTLLNAYFNRSGSKGAFSYPGATWDRFRCTVEPSPGHIRCRISIRDLVADRNP